MAQAEAVLSQALGLPAIDRANLVDRLLASLDLPSPVVDETWRREIEARLDAHKSGRMDAVPLDAVLAKYASP